MPMPAFAPVDKPELCANVGAIALVVMAAVAAADVEVAVRVGAELVELKLKVFYRHNVSACIRANFAMCER